MENKYEFERYLIDDCEEENAEFNVLKWWKEITVSVEFYRKWHVNSHSNIYSFF